MEMDVYVNELVVLGQMNILSVSCWQQLPLDPHLCLGTGRS